MTVKGETPENLCSLLQCEAGCLEESCITEGKTPANFRILCGTQPSREDTKLGSLGGAFRSHLGALGTLLRHSGGPS